MKYLYHFIAWSSLALALVLGPLALLFWAGWELSKVPGLFDQSITFDEEAA